MDQDTKSKRGRPRYEPTEEDRERVCILAGGGESHEAIALTLGIARQTLEVYFPTELSVGAYRKRAEVKEALYKAAANGSVSAAREYLSTEPKLAAPPEEKTPALGKKAQAEEDAKTAHIGTDWEKILAPDETTSSLQ